MVIATWNIGEYEKNKDGKLDILSYEYLLKLIKQKDLDILCLREVIIKSDCFPSIANDMFMLDNTNLLYSANDNTT